MDMLMGGAPNARGVDAAQGLNWWSRAWALFVRQAAWWVIFGLVFIVTVGVLMVLPVVGHVAAALVMPVLMGGFMLAARKVEGGGTLQVADLLAGFQRHLSPLIVLGALLTVVTLIITAVAGLLGMGALFGVAAGGVQGSIGGVMAGMGAGMLAMLVSLLFGMVVGMVFWFAPALVVFRNTPPVDALKASFMASLKNIVPFLVYSVVYFIVAFIASIPFGLGWLVLVPVMLLTVYVSYQDVFGA